MNLTASATVGICGAVVKLCTTLFANLALYPNPQNIPRLYNQNVCNPSTQIGRQNYDCPALEWRFRGSRRGTDGRHCEFRRRSRGCRQSRDKTYARQRRTGLAVKAVRPGRGRGVGGTQKSLEKCQGKVYKAE